MLDVHRPLLPGERFVDPKNPGTAYVSVPFGHVAAPVEKLDDNGNRVIVIEFVKAPSGLVKTG